MAENETLGARARRARDARGLSQVVVAQRARVDQTAVSKIERDKLNPEDATLGRLADVLGVSVAWLRSGDGNGPTTGEPSETRRVAVPHAVFDEALGAAFDAARGHKIADLDALRSAFAGESLPATATPDELASAARRMLDAAAELRRSGESVTVARVLLKVAS